jgi:hypothetical protein
MDSRFFPASSACRRFSDLVLSCSGILRSCRFCLDGIGGDAAGEQGAICNTLNRVRSAPSYLGLIEPPQGDEAAGEAGDDTDADEQQADGKRKKMVSCSRPRNRPVVRI